MRQFNDMFRPNFDTYGIFSWSTSAILILVFRPPMWHLMLLIALIMLIYRFRASFELYQAWIAINSNSLIFRPINVIISIYKKLYQEKCFWLGYGFVWDQSCAEKAHHISIRNKNELKDLPSWMKNLMWKSLSVPPKKRDFQQKAICYAAKKLFGDDVVAGGYSTIGKSWIHGLSTEKDMNIPLSINALQGHTLILGTTGSGKTRLYELMCLQFIHANKTLIVFDPKNDFEWRDRLEKECKRTGRTFLNFELARPTNSVQIDPLANFNNISELGMRIAQLVDAEGSFAAFASKTLSQITSALYYVGVKPSIKLLKRYVSQGVDQLATDALTKAFFTHLGPNWDRDLTKPETKAKKDALDPRLESMIDLYQKLPISKVLDPLTGVMVDKSIQNESIDGLISMLRHDKGHYSKMIQVLEPIMQLLGTGEVGDLLSPNYEDETNFKPIWSFKKIIEQNCVLYIGLNSLSNGILAAAVGSILLADLAACAGAIYNAKNKQQGKDHDIYLIVDETSEVINMQATQLLNKGRGAGFKVFLATQTIADFRVRYGSGDKADQALGNLNNLICLRLKDNDSAKYVSDMFGKTEARVIEKGFSSGTESSAAVTEFRGQTSTSLKSKEVPLVSSDLILNLPNMNYFAMIGGTLFKGRLPLIKEQQQ